MNKQLIILFLVFIPFSLFGEITFPESMYVVDVETGFKIMLGLPPAFVEKEYGTPKEKKLQHKFSSGREDWIITYDDFVMRYETRNMRLTSIRITTPRFCASSGIKIGDTLSDVIRIYGHPSYTTTNTQGELIYLYEKVFKEINIIAEAEYTLMQFVFIHDKIIAISFYISNAV